MAESEGERRALEIEDTISLIDLFAVVLRRRRLIILSTLCAVALGIIAYFVYPAYSLAKAERERIVEVNMSLMLGSSFDGSIAEVEGTNFLIQTLTDPSTILAALRTAGYNKVDKIPIEAGDAEDRALYSIRRRLVENKAADGSGLKESSRLYSVKLDKSVVSIVFKNGDPEKARAFLGALLVTVERDLHAFILPFAESIIASYERFLMMQNPSEAVEASIAQGYRDYSIAKSIAAGTSSTLTILRKPYVLVPELSLATIQKDVLKKAIILVFGVFFMAVFAAFVLQYVDTVKKDPESMSKLRDALAKPRS